MAVAIDHGYLPAGRYVLNHDIMHCTADAVAGNHLYSGRALGISEPWDIIQLHPDLQSQWQDICAHYERIGLRHSREVIWHVHPEALGEHIGYHPSVFYFGTRECRYWGDNAWLETVEHINSKNNFIALAEQLGVDVPSTLCIDDAARVTDALLSEVAYPCYLKAAVSVSGVGIHRCRNGIELRRALARFGSGVPIQLQEEVQAEVFLNLQYRIIGKEVVRLAASEQMLDGCTHQGNRFPAAYAPWAAVDPLAHWLGEQGIKGVFAFDVAVAQSRQGLRFPVIECNPRFNGASYPTFIAQKLDIPEWLALTFATRHRSLAAIDLSGIEFDPETGVGAVLVNWGPVLAGKLLVMLAGSPRQQEALRLELAARLW